MARERMTPVERRQAAERRVRRVADAMRGKPVEIHKPPMEPKKLMSWRTKAGLFAATSAAAAGGATYLHHNRKRDDMSEVGKAFGRPKVALKSVKSADRLAGHVGRATSASRESLTRAEPQGELSWRLRNPHPSREPRAVHDGGFGDRLKKAKADQAAGPHAHYDYNGKRTGRIGPIGKRDTNRDGRGRVVSSGAALGGAMSGATLGGVAGGGYGAIRAARRVSPMASYEEEEAAAERGGLKGLKRGGAVGALGAGVLGYRIARGPKRKMEKRDAIPLQLALQEMTPEERRKHVRANTIGGAVYGGVTGAATGASIQDAMHDDWRKMHWKKGAAIGGAVGALGIGALARHESKKARYNVGLVANNDRVRKNMSALYDPFTDQIVEIGKTLYADAVRDVRSVTALMPTGGSNRAPGLRLKKVSGSHTGSLPRRTALTHIHH